MMSFLVSYTPSEHRINFIRPSAVFHQLLQQFLSGLRLANCDPWATCFIHAAGSYSRE